ncbi:peptidyl-tRNA hydrolase [Actinokineospora sp. UTMC 2448]|nr:peptidyl-tRNA hydrolase [Actinokineospora sp. UTMC 2448]
MSVLSGLFDRDGAEPSVVRAMPVILRVERDLPRRTPLLEAAAAAAVAVCLDERAQEGGEWHPLVSAWIDGRIRKVSRRARGAHWHAVQDLPGVTVSVDGASARALLPWPVDETPKTVSRLQISGTELPMDEPGPVADGVPVLWVNPTVEMTVGKLAAQVGHGSMLLAAMAEADGVDLSKWDCHCAVRMARPGEWNPDVSWERDRAVAVRDAGFTEVEPGTVTVVAQWG